MLTLQFCAIRSIGLCPSACEKNDQDAIETGKIMGQSDNNQQYDYEKEEEKKTI